MAINQKLLIGDSYGLLIGDGYSLKIQSETIWSNSEKTGGEWSNSEKTGGEAEAFALSIGNGYNLLIDSTNKLHIQSTSAGTSWSNAAKN